MLNDITFGQYINRDSFIHKLDPRTKLILTMAFIIALFLINNPLGYIVAIIYTIFFYILGHISVRLALKNLKPLIPILIFTFLINLFLVSGDKVLCSFGFLTITSKGLRYAITMVIRIIILIASSSILTYTTLPITLTDGIENLLTPLKKIKFPAHELSMMMTIALRFIPTLIEETNKIIMAQKSRGADMETKNLIKKAKALTPILVPLFISSFKRAEDLAMAMEARCYNGGKGRTRLKVLSFSFRDLVATIFLILFIAIIIVINIYGVKMI